MNDRRAQEAAPLVPFAKRSQWAEPVVNHQELRRHQRARGRGTTHGRSAVAKGMLR